MNKQGEDKVVAISMRFNPQLRLEAERRGWRLLNLKLYNYLLPRNSTLDGLLTTDLPDHPEILKLRKRGLPSVRIGEKPHVLDKEVPAVILDPISEGRAAAEHFAERGFKCVVLVSNHPWWEHEELFAGFSERAQELGMTCLSEKFGPKDSKPLAEHIADKQKQLLEFIKNQAKPLGLFIATPFPAAQVSAWILDAGYKIPSDVAILTCADDRSSCTHAMPSISYVSRNPERRIQMACDILDRMMAGETISNHTVRCQPDGVVELESTRILAVDDPVVAAAVHFIWANLCNEIGVQEVADEVGFSRRQLERRFSLSLERSVGQEIRRRRLEVFTQLLIGSDEPIVDLGKRVGFRSPNYLFQRFRKTFGMSPAEFRSQQSV